MSTSASLKPGVNVAVAQGVATITFNRPKTLNAITAEGACPLPSLACAAA